MKVYKKKLSIFVKKKIDLLVEKNNFFRFIKVNMCFEFLKMYFMINNSKGF